MVISARYARQVLLPQVGEAGQQQLARSRVLVVGCGGLGSPALQYLAAAGVGHITLLDADHVEMSNLNRQILYETGDVGRWKVDAAKDALLDLNPELVVDAQRERLDAKNATHWVREHDLVVDGTDNFASRDALNSACLQTDTAWVFAAARQWQAQVGLFVPGKTACWRCLVDDVPATTVNACADAGIMGVTVGLAGLWQAVAAVHYLLGQAEGWMGKLLLLDAHQPASRWVSLPRDRACPACVGTR